MPEMLAALPLAVISKVPSLTDVITTTTRGFCAAETPASASERHANATEATAVIRNAFIGDCALNAQSN